MYIGNDGIVGLFAEILRDCIELCEADRLTFEINIVGDNEFSIGLSGQQNLTTLLHQFRVGDSASYIFVLQTISELFEITSNNIDKVQITFSFDKTIIPNTVIDYLKLSEKMVLVALLNRQTEIITIDKRGKYLSQNYYHFPQGILYLFEKAKTEVLGKPKVEVFFDVEIGSNKYQIGIAYSTDWYPMPNITSFANDIQTVRGGSMVYGIVDGLVTACRKYIKVNSLTAMKIKRKKLLNGLIIVCAVRGGDFSYGGSFKETLEDDLVKKQAEKITEKLIFDFLSNHKEKADSFLWRFDTTRLTSGMY
jgi:DNA gyrase/topoisomerase IV subunit B